MVVMMNQNLEDIHPMVDLTQKYNVDVRFIEEMPFNGSGGHDTFWPSRKTLEHIAEKYSYDKLEDPAFSTSKNYRVKEAKGSFGLIDAYTRTFCGTCNRIRVTPEGQLKTCLYDDGVLNLRDLIRSGAGDDEISKQIRNAVGHRAKDGWDAEKQRSKNHPVSESMATIGG